nr:uncharacterized protein LOC125423443 [Ziziphus jujuba var. spinosa]
MDSNCEGNLKDFYAATLHQARISNFHPQILGEWASVLLNNISFFNNQERSKPIGPIPEPGHISGPSDSKIASKEIPPTLLKRAAQALSEHPFRKSPRVIEELEDFEPISFESFQGSAGTQEERPQEPREESPNTPSTQITTAIFEENSFSQGSYEANSGRSRKWKKDARRSNIQARTPSRRTERGQTSTNHQDFHSTEEAVKDLEEKQRWCFLGVYGTPYRKEKAEFWELLEETILNCKLPWLILRDLNEILDDTEKVGGKGFQRNHSYLNTFVQNVGAIDLGFLGKKFTWENKQEGRSYIKERLDRGLANQDWLSLFSEAKISHLALEQSDHSPLLLYSHENKKRRDRPFRFLKAWTDDISSGEIIKKAWNEETRNGMEAHKLLRRLHNAEIALKRWNKSHFGFVQENIKRLEKELEEIQYGREEERAKQTVVENELRIQEPGWKASANRNLGKHGFLKEIEGYTELFTSSNPVFGAELDDMGVSYITEEENSRLMAIPLEEEIRKTVWELHPLKAPGPDGFSGIFYKSYWRIVKTQLIDMVQEIFRTKNIIRGVNKTMLVLIPKTKNASNLNQFRPISLCNFCYKIVAKILTTRLRPLMSKIISPHQGAFLEGRWIMENTVVGQEVAHKVRKHKGKNGLMLVKIDMKKAYDRLGWQFITKALKL